MPSKLQKAIGAVKDQTSISLAKVASNNTSNLEVAVLKATTHEDIPMDDRYVYEVLQLVSSSKYYAAACARAIGKRISRTRNWIVALKSLMLVLRIFQDGDPYFPREVLHAMKRGAKILNLTSFRDDSNTSPWDFTAFVRTFALYLDERLECFLTGKLQRRYRHGLREAFGQRSQKANEPVRDMKPAMLLDRISYWQRLLERAIATRPTGSAKTNRLVQVCLYAVVQESFDLYKDVSDGLALLLDSFFHLQYQNCVNAFQICVKASKQFQELSTFYSLCKGIGVGRTSEYPSVQSISEELMEILQEFLKDQSSFTSHANKSPNPLMLLPPPPNAVSRSGRHDSYGNQSEISSITDRYSERTSEWGSQSTSLEELISATEISITTPSISIDLEDYSEQFDKKTQKDAAFCNFSDTGSTQSLPISSSIGDLVSLDDWPDRDEADEKNKKQNQEPVQEQKEKPLESTSSSIGWEIELAGITIPQNLPNSSNSCNEQNQIQKEDQISPPDASGNGWELALIVDPPTTSAQPKNNDFNLLSLDNLYQMNSAPTSHQYNPFLQDILDLPAMSPAADFQLSFDPFASAPAFQETADASTFQAYEPTFSAKSASTVANQFENDPFAAFSSDQTTNGSLNSRDFLEEQQLWLQNQNKIIEKHLS